MVGCLFLGLVMGVLALAVLVIPLGTALSFAQAAVVSALLAAAAWTAWGALRESGPLALVLDDGDADRCYPSLPESEAGVVVLEFEGGGDALRVVRGPEDRPGLGGDSFSSLSPDVERPRLELRRARPGARSGRLVLSRGRTTLWESDVRVGRPILLSDTAARVLGMPTPSTLMFVDR